MRFGSLFSGIGGLDLGLERAGLECRWQVENDDYASRVLAKHWPDVTRYGDIREVDFGAVESVELLAGGFPCQDLSYAGKGLGLSGARSGLWSEFKRAVRDLGPRYVLVENVPGLLGRGMGAVLGDLASLGYDSEWQSVPAAAFGAPHLRWRVFIVARYVAYAASERREEGCEFGKQQPQRAARCGQVPDTNRAGRSEQRRSVSVFAEHSAPELCSWWEVEPALGRVVDGFPGRVDQLRGLGNAVVPQVGEWLGRLILNHERRCAA